MGSVPIEEGPALVGADGRRVSVLAVWHDPGGELPPALEVVREDRDAVEVVLRRRRRSVLPPGAAVPLVLIGPRTVTGTLPDPLRGRRLVDSATGREVPCFHAYRLAQVTWLPDGYRFETDAHPHTLRGGPFPPEVLAWSRVYITRTPIRGFTHEIRIVQALGRGLTTLGPGWTPSGTVPVGAHEASAYDDLEPGTARPTARAVSWSSATNSYLVRTGLRGRLPEPEDIWAQPVLPPAVLEDVPAHATLLRVARGLREPTRDR
ncbi:hypothetical protein B0I33_10129 [Prauserella shujinwangii]|uniref:Uncharacterized protein n=1 Tax=Prauserella shujinwangii TaxID=1453103 RepID=A0A2T0M297_9PSEU|nr:hypothetical protein [Prauserella shujinwangii]PRX50878.1 hypothetical protein B0I33_10129 [Prauserella shujinwangii]